MKKRNIIAFIVVFVLVLGMFPKVSYSNTAYHIGDLVWHDLNKNGIQDSGEPGIEGVKVTIKNLDWDITKETTTGADGKWGESIINGEVEITFSEIPAGYTETTANVGNDDSIDSDGVNFVLDIDSDDDTLDLGLIKEEPTPTYELGDYVWFDEDKDGIQDASEGGVQGVTVTLTKPDNSTETKTTDENGKYLFEGLEDGEYKVEFTNFPTDYEPTSTNQGTDYQLDSDGQTVDVAIIDHDNMSIDFGLVKKEEPAPTYKLGDYVWYDVDKDGLQGLNESGVEGVKVTLTKADGSTKTTVTNDIGYYEFDGLVNGEYTLTFSQIPADYEITTTDVGDDDTIDSDGLNVNAVIDDENNMTIDLGLKNTDTTPSTEYKLGDRVWYDANKDGLQEATENGVEGVKVTLTKADGSTKTTMTNADGYYEFEGLVNGEYTVTFSQIPANYEITETNVGDDDTIDSDGLSVKAKIDDENNMTIDLGLVEKEIQEPTYKLGDYVWYDTNNNGVQEDQEVGVKNVKVVLRDETGAKLKETFTNTDGYYEFKGLVNGTYLVEFSELPAGYQETLTNQGGDDAKDSDGLNPTAKILRADNMTVDLGLVKKEKPRYHKIGDYVWYDENGNGIQDDDENGVQGVKVTLFVNNDRIAETLTDEYGYYEFDELSDDEYVVKFSELPIGYTITLTGQGDDIAKDSNGLESEAVVAGEDNMTIDLGLLYVDTPVEDPEEPELPRTGTSSNGYYVLFSILSIVLGIVLINRKSLYVK